MQFTFSLVYSAYMWKFGLLFLFFIFKDSVGSNWFITFPYQMFLETCNVSHEILTHTSGVSVPGELSLIWRTLN